MKKGGEADGWMRVPFCVKADEVFWLFVARGQLRVRVRRRGKRSGWILIEQRGEFSEVEASYAREWIRATVKGLRRR
jgi:hypothetical protein